MEETLRLQFGTASTALGTQWAALQRVNGVTNTPHVLSFEAKNRIRRQTRIKPKTQEDTTAWAGGIQVYDQSGSDLVPTHDGLWNWSLHAERNLVEVDEFRPHLPMHNFYEGYAVSNGGNISNLTLENAQDRVRAILETCDQLRLVEGLVDMDSSWGGLAHEMLTYTREECPGAVVMVMGNDWSYPLASDDSDAIFRVASDARDRSKIEARKRVNLASSVALLSEASTLLIPVAMTPGSLSSLRLPQLRFDRVSYGDVGSVVATALEVAMSAHRGRSAYEILEGLQPSMKVVELAASFPFTDDPTVLLQRINDNITNEIGHKSQDGDPFQSCSLLPSVDKQQRQVHPHKVHYRRLHFRGPFSDYSSLRSAIDASPMSPRDVTLQWSESSPLVLPESYRVQTFQSVSVDAISQLSLTSRTGDYLSALAQRVSKNDKRTLYEFTRAGMSPDAPEELEATLAAMGDAYSEQ
ncbi:hypothetical protein BBO99_00008027 [Phytophthora kernoviae]|uniref:DML1/Misato tubulin domain-containing protein n=2 Tax=Phytophthora kernoviae TaxID=325452 RepID=A0A3R7IHA4_9STRA|nr:hypothetical protein G195_008435 [Phytophthora kernoviae 00238/432]KAG2517167.1 hypothetical protein JM16_007141 [Phytophthora kernoviae]KAG2519406.1 hypothetical protein JM18_007561 [Phytophthora kernoviae]RLN13937.1 hypothetical protein BBI17_007243 [Phytophthora kernoviae]RLN75837.1 hypothetical protein BBO99_00008027 [Phytophthora kernoviae]